MNNVNWLKKIQPDEQTENEYQHGFHDAIKVVIDRLEFSPTPSQDVDLRARFEKETGMRALLTRGASSELVANPEYVVWLESLIGRL